MPPHLKQTVNQTNIPDSTPGTTQETALVTPITADQRERAIEKTNHYIALASKHYAKKFKTINILFNLTGSTAGMYRVAGRQRWIRYNPYIFSRYFDDSIQTTVPHEVAHYITDCLYGLKKIRPHGNEWKSVMALFGVEPNVTGNYNLDGIPQRKQQRHDYSCECMQHQLSTVRHNRIQHKSVKYFCKKCKQILTFNPIDLR